MVPFSSYFTLNNRDLEKVTEMSFKLVPFESLGAVSYSHSIITMGLSCIISELKRRTGRKSRYPVAFDTTVRGFPSEYRHTVW